MYVCFLTDPDFLEINYIVHYMNPIDYFEYVMWLKFIERLAEKMPHTFAEIDFAITKELVRMIEIWM